MRGIQIKNSSALWLRSIKYRISEGGNTQFDRLLTIVPSWRGFYQASKIVLVADNDEPANSFTNVTEQIKRAAPSATPPVTYGVPDNPLEFADGSPAKLAVLMIPIGGAAGNLESLCLPAAREGRAPLVASVDKFANDIGADKWLDRKQSKLKLRVLLAGQYKKDPFIKLSSALWKGVIPLDHVCFQPVVDFLKSL